MNFEITRNKLTIKDAIGFIERIVSSYFIEDENGNLTYEPYSGMLGAKTAFLEYYTDYEFSNDMDKDYEFICSLDIGDYEFLDRNTYIQYCELMEAAKKKVKYKKQALLKEQTDGIYHLLITLSNKIKEINIPDLNSDDLNTFIKKFNGADLSSDSVVKAFLDSDYHKKQEAELLDAKNEVIKQMENGMEERIMKRLFESRNVVNMLDTSATKASSKPTSKSRTTTRKKKTEKVE